MLTCIFKLFLCDAFSASVRNAAYREIRAAITVAYQHAFCFAQGHSSTLLCSCASLALILGPPWYHGKIKDSNL